MNDVAVLRDIGMIGEGAQDVDRAAFDIIGLKLTAEGELPALGEASAARRVVKNARWSERSSRLLSVPLEDEAQAAVHFPGGGLQRLADLGDVE